LPPGTTEIYPGTLGGVLTPLAFTESKIFATYNDAPAYLSPDGAGQRPDTPAPRTGGIAALDAATGTILWDVKIPGLQVSGATVINDLVFTSGLDAVLHAYNIETGEEVWNWETPAGVNAPMGVAGDTIVFAAATGISVSPLDGTPAAERESTPSIVALKLGASS
jgi:outer membrane protein assembly factor BamB